MPGSQRDYRLLVLGAGGMLGHTLFKRALHSPSCEVYASARKKAGLTAFYNATELERVYDGIDAENFDSVAGLIHTLQPTVIVNCIGIIKQLLTAQDPLSAITVNAQLPHLISAAAKSVGARLIQISTDSVFSGNKGQSIRRINSVLRADCLLLSI
jgi:dTDP-4-dehydrorhamnose reductase